MRLQRLFHMSPAELAFRGRQEVFKAVERLSVPAVRKKHGCRFDRSALDASMTALLDQLGEDGSSGAAGALQNQLQERMNRRFFAGLRDDRKLTDIMRSLEAGHGSEAQQSIAGADAACREEFSILGYGTLSFGRPINWSLDPISGRESPWVHWSRLDPLAPDQVGDSKVVWELNRHQWLLELGQAYGQTGDEKYARCFVSLLDDWIERNPPGWGINWSSALEVAMRLISWCWALCLFKGSRALGSARYLKILGCLQAHADFVARNLSRYFSPNTHLTVEALALYYAGTLLPELQGAVRWRDLGRSVLLEQLPLQVPKGGVYFEQSTRYQYYTVEIYLHFAILAARNEDALPQLVNQRLGEMLHFLLELRRPDGTVPQIGDTDGGWLCPLVRRSAGDYQGLFSTAALLLNDPRLAWAAESIALESRLLLGERADAKWASLMNKQAPSTGSGACEAEGYIIMRSGWDRDAHQLIFDTGPLGCFVSGGHGHADLLAVQCSAFGENYLVDPGTGCYSADSPWRQHFRSTRAHSTVLVDGQSQAATNGPFSWRERPDARLLAFESGQGQTFAAARHTAYQRLEDPVTHLRRVWFLDASLWLIVDDLHGALPHQVDLRFQFAPLPVNLEAGGWVRARGENSGLLLKTFSSSEVETDLVTGARGPLLGWHSPNYGQHVPAPALTVGSRSALPLRFATLVLPLRDPDALAPMVEPHEYGGLLNSLSISSLPVGIPEFGEIDPGRSGTPWTAT